MTLSANTQAILLLTARFGKGDSSANKPLTPTEYGRFAEWLRVQSLTPERLLGGDLKELLHGWEDKKVTVERISALLDRGSALALSMEKWLRAGLWVMTRSDADYPKRLKQRLRSDSPAILFGCGNRALLNTGGLAVVGSRKVSQDDLAYSIRIGEMASSAGVSIVSGGARGVDESAMLGALGAEGTAVGVLADNLLRVCSSGKYRQALIEKNLALVSPFYPEAGFNVGNAMARNRYIYCLADAALAVHSGKKGGTWNGAKEDLKNRWVPLWVKRTDDLEAGNGDLIAEGALEAPADIESVRIESFIEKPKEQPQQDSDIFGSRSVDIDEPSVTGIKEDIESASVDLEHSIEEQHGLSPDSCESGSGPAADAGGPEAVDLSQISLYELFVCKVIALCAVQPMSTEELLDGLSITKPQLNAWLKRAVKDGHLKKLTKPVRYEVSSSKQGALVLD